MSDHAAIRPARRGRKIAAIASGLILIPAVAYAAYVLLVGVTGSVTTANVGYTLLGASTKHTESMTCTTTVKNGAVHISVTDAYPGGRCEIGAAYEPLAGSTEYLKAQNVSFADTDPNVSLDFLAGADTANWDTNGGYGDGCGATATDTSNAMIPMVLTISEDAPMGQTFNAASNAGVEFVPAADFDPALCGK